MPLVPDANPLLILATVLTVGIAFGAAARRARLPSITGQIVAGVAMGAAGLNVFEEHAVHGLRPLTHFALGLMAVTVGAHLSFSRLRNAGRRLGYLVLLEALLVPAFVFAVVVWFPQMNTSFALLLGALAISTAPATTIALVKETRSRGVFVKTLVGAVALNNLVCIFLFELARAGAKVALSVDGATTSDLVSIPLKQVAVAGLLGALAAATMAVIWRLVRRPELQATGGFVTILLTTGAANHVGVSPLLASLFLGIIQANLHRERDKVVDTMFKNFEPAILATFFTLAGMELTLGYIRQAGLLALAFFSARVAGKVVAARLAMSLAGATERLRANLGLALIPQAGLAVGLVLLLEEDAALRVVAGPLVPVFVAVVLTAVVANELVGPILTRMALGRSGEVGRDRTRLIDFIHEENIVTGLRAKTKEDAIRDLVDLLVDSHRLDQELKPLLLESVMARERELSTCIGRGLAVPHGVLPEGSRMLGVMGLSAEGLRLDAPDDVPVHCIVLLATPDGERARHLEVLAALARTVGTDERVSGALFSARSPAHAYEILHDEEAEAFNPFLEEPA